MTYSKDYIHKHFQKYMDGGFTDNMVVFNEGRTILVSPFCGRQDISPNDKSGRQWYVGVNNQGFQVNKNNLIRLNHAMFPPSSKVLTQYFDQGFQDATRFLMKEKSISVEIEHNFNIKEHID